ncbi:MAG: primosomal protein N' [Candidatus Eremiobacteraeota bacterium]|nr:primosomal protein N' [Candidatus Eremiobacteraeota bacterium]
MIATPAATRVALVDVIVGHKTARVERPLTYAVPPGLTVSLGDVVRVPLGSRELYGFVISPPRGADVAPAGMRELAALADAPRAFDATGLALAQFLATRYCCSLGEALDTIVHTAAVPRVVDRFVLLEPPDAQRYPSVPPRLLRLVREDFADGFGLDDLLRHPEARRAGDGRTLLAAVGALTRGGALRRERQFAAARVAPARERVLAITGSPASGARVRALVAQVAAGGCMRRSDARLAGFSAAVIARAITSGALRETLQPLARTRTAGPRLDDDFEPTDEQRRAIAVIDAAASAPTFGEVLVQGVTGSGKTFVYIRAIAWALLRGDRAIVLVPEIALTPQTARRFEAAFGERVAVLHSALSERERFESRDAAARGAIDVVVGARSAVFAPLSGVRLVIVDEAHERSYKQDGTPRYDAVTVARERMRLAGGTLVLGSATPPLDAYARARTGTIAHARLERRATGHPLPSVHVVDLTAEFERGNRRIFSTPLVDALGARLSRGEKSVLFVNRRGSGSFMLCRRCGVVPECTRCSVSLVAHRAEALLRCHLCDAQRALPERCPVCGDGSIREFGVGTQRVASTVADLFPTAKIVRMDSDTTTRIGDHARVLDEFAQSGDILIGTQMIAKGLDFPTVTLVGVVAADIGLHAPDFRAAERTFDLVTQVIGRSGRARAGEAIVQTYSPHHPAIAFAVQHDYDGFAAYELANRRELGYPPFAELTYLAVAGRSRTTTFAAAERYAELLRRFGGAEILGPAPAPVAKLNEEWWYRIALKTHDGAPLRHYLRETLRDLAAGDRGIRLAINVDP